MAQPILAGLDHLVLTVADIGASVEFYTSVLGMEAVHFPVADGTTRTALSFGAQKINLHQSGAEFSPHARTPTPGSSDLCFLSDVPLEDWVDWLGAQGATIKEGPVPRTGAQAPIRSIYLDDPDGNLLEISNLL